MAKLRLYNIKRDQTIELVDSGQAIEIGRDFFNCPDKRVSRRHGLLTVINAQIKIKACHVNPIFYQIRGSNASSMLTKDDAEILLGELDKFSLLPNDYEYEIRIAREQAEVRVRNVVEINDNLEAGNMATSLSQIIAAGEASAAPSGQPDEDADKTLSPDKAGSSCNRKRACEGSDTSEEGSKRRKNSTAEQNAAEISTATGSSITIKPDPDATTITTTSGPAAAASSGSVITIKPDPDAGPAATSSGTAGSNVTIKPDLDAVKTEPVKTSTQNTSSSTVVKPTTPTTPVNQSNPGQRQSCQYGVRCYRNTPEHRREVAHPTDQDYRRPTYPPAPSGTADCPWGASCYRRNPEHFQVLQHPPASKI